MKKSENSVPKNKICKSCQINIAVAFRIRITPNKDWYFVCKNCCVNLAKSPGYQYGGTWKGKNH